MKTSLIITTYNWKEALKVVLETVKRQKLLPDEVIVADDGSREDTADVIKAVANGFPVPLIHCWQEDAGFRAAQSRNRAIAKSTGDYLIIIDGDIVLPQTFVADHVQHAKQGLFIQGGRVLFDHKISEQVIATGVFPAFFSRGIKNRKNLINSQLLSKLFSKISNSDKSTRSCNMSFWKEDVLTVNGFNQDFVGWGREDSEFTHRLLNLGKKRLYLKFSGVGYHLYHAENERGTLAENDKILADTIEQKRVYCDKGINQFIEE